MSRTPTMHEQARIDHARSLQRLALYFMLLAEMEREQLRREDLLP